MEPNIRWAMDFVSGGRRNGSDIRVLTVIDEVTRECLALEVNHSLTGKRVTAVLNGIAPFRGLPKEILTDNGSVFTRNMMNAWADDYKLEHIFTDPGRPTQNGYIESFNGKLRAAGLNQHWFRNIPEAKDTIENWCLEYNQVRPHSSLNNLTPVEYALELSCNYEHSPYAKYEL